MRKYLFTIAISMAALIAGAQINVGQWKIHPYFVGANVANCVDAGERVYYLVSGSLFCYDKATGANESVNSTGKLNSESIKQIYYNYNKGYLFVTYDDSNIDVIKNDGTVVNISALKDVILNKAKDINDVTFGENKTYVATSFGYIAIEDETFRVMEAKYFDVNILSVAQVGQYKIMILSNKFYYCKVDEQVDQVRWHSQADNSAGDGYIFPASDNSFFLTTKSSLYRVTLTENGDGTLSFSPSKVASDIPSVVQRCASGIVASHFYYTTSGPYGAVIKNYRDYYYTFDSDGSNAVQHDGAGVYSSHENGNWWVTTASGLTHVVNGVMGDELVPDGITICKNAYWTTYDPYMHRVLLCRACENNVLSYDQSNVTEINSYDGDKWRTITPQFDDTFGSNFWIVVSPNEPDTYFFSFRKIGGIAKVKNGNLVLRYDPVVSNHLVSERGTALAFDSKGNLWSAQPYAGFKADDPDPSPDVVVLTPEKQALSEITPADFIVNDLGKKLKDAGDGYKRMVFGVGAGDTKVFSTGSYNAPLIIWNNNDDLSLKQYRVFNSFNDQDNKFFSTYGWTYIKADNDGRIWLGTVSGIVSMDPREAFNDDFRITRNKVTKNEGKAVNEVLLEGTQVNCIDVDQLNRKWVGTNTAGIYLVSADGSEIIKHFDMSNSVMPSDQVYSVCCNRATGSVVAVTANGVVEYYGDMTPSASDYSNVYAYPNPVQSSFTGFVTITGLMENSTVVITDIAGNQVATATSTGGVALWDACNAQGVPVKTGIYKVYAAQGQAPSTTGTPVTRIAVIK